MLVSQINTSSYSSATSADVSPAPQPVFQSSASASASTVAPSNTASAPNADQVKDAVKQINDVVQTMNKDLKFTVDESTGIHVVTVVDTKTNDVIRQFPSADVISIAKALDRLKGLLIQQKA